MRKALIMLLLLSALATLGADVLSPDEFALQIHQEINAIRARHDLPSLEWLDDLADLALIHSRNMGDHSFFGHEDHEGLRISQRQLKYHPELILAGIGENLYCMERGARVFDPRAIALGWMNSEGHRNNILNENYTHEGIAVFLLENKLYTTQVLAIPVLKRLSPLPPQFSQGRSYPLEFEYLALEPKESFACHLGTPDPNTKVQLDLMTFTHGSAPLELTWNGNRRLTLPLEFKYGAGTYRLQLGWDGYFYDDMLEFRVE